MYAAAMGNTITAVFQCLSAISVKGFLSLSRLVSLLALCLKLAQAFQYALPFGRLCLLFLGGFSFFPDLPLPCGKVTIVLLYNSLRFAVGCHERLHIGITVLFQNIGQSIQFFSDSLFCPLYLFCERLALLTFENPFCVGKLLFQFRKYRILQIKAFPRELSFRRI